MKTNVYTIIWGMLFFAIIVYNIALFNSTVNEEIEKSARNTLIDMADQQQIAINRQLDNLIYNIISLSEAITVMSIEEESLEFNTDIIFEYLTKKQEDLHFENVIVSDSKGKVLVSTLDVENISKYNYFNAAVIGEAFATETTKFDYSDVTGVTVAVPIYLEGNIVGVLTVEYGTEYLTSLLTSFTEEKGINLIINKDSEIMLSTSSFVISFDAFASAEFDGGLTFEQIKKDFKDGKSGSISYTINGTKKLGEYRPIEINDWILFFEISEESMVKSATNISIRMITISAAIIIFAFAIILLVWFSRKNHLNELEKIAYHDELTGGPNLQKLKMHMKNVLESNPEEKYIIVKMDVANFKAINEIYGFETADKVLCAIAENSKDINEKTFLKARISADEFIMFSGGYHLEILEETKDHYEAYFRSLLPELKEHNFYFRYGRYVIPPGEKDVNDILNKVSTAHKFAKIKSTNNLWDYDEVYTQKVLKNAEIANKMHNALKNKEFRPFLQPKYDIEKKRIVGAEALVRWIEADNNIIFPGDFIPLFEENGFIIELDKYILRCVCEVLKEWKEKGVENIPISVNFSRLHVHNLNLVKELKKIVSSYGINTNSIEIELTETTVLENENELLRVIAELREADFSISIDDFGAGYSSLGMLKNFKVDTLKLDRSFFVNADDGVEVERGKNVVKSIVELSTALGMHIVAEGIEHKEQLEFLKSVNCSIVQGYYYSKPISVKDFEAKYVESSFKINK